MFKDKFATFLKETEMKIPDVSRETHIPVTTMYDWIHGRTEPSIKYVRILTKTYDLPPGYFVE